jgi:hypothetical protein
VRLVTAYTVTVRQRRLDPAGDADRLGGVGEVQASDGGDLEAADLQACVPAVAGVVLGWDAAPGQGGELVVQGGLVALDDEQVGGVLGGDQPLGVLTLGVERVSGHHPTGKVQPVQQRPEPGDLVGGVVDTGLAQDRQGGVVHRGEQVDLRIGVVAAAAQGLAVDRDRPPGRPGCRWRPGGRWGWLVGQPPADHLVQRVRVDARQDAADGGLGGWPIDPAQRVAARPERGQDRLGRVGCPFADRGQGLGAGQHRGDRDGQHRAQRVPSATTVPGVGDVGEVVEQAAALVGWHRVGRGQPVGNCGDGR